MQTVLVKIKKLGSECQHRRFVRGLLKAGGTRISRSVYEIPDSLIPGGRYSDSLIIVVGGDSGLSRPGEKMAKANQ